MSTYKFNEEINCNTCKHGYCSYIDDYHNICGAGNCYLCAKSFGECDDYEKGTPPENAEEM